MIVAELTHSPGWTSELLAGLTSFVVRATVILLLAWILAHVLRRASSAARHLIWSGAIAGVLALPILQAIVPTWTVPVFTIAAAVGSPSEPAVTLPTTSPVAEPVVAELSTHPKASAGLPVPARLTPERSNQNPSFTTILRSAFATLNADRIVTIAWLAIAVLLLVRLAVATARVAGWQRASRAVENERWLALVRRLCRQYRIERPVVLLESDESDVPVTWGVVYPVILLPATTADAWDEEQRIAVLTHELAHVKRFDALTQLLAQFALALLWFHPLMWMAVRRMRQEREHACDDFVLAAGARASRYADDLLGLARRLSRPAAPAAAALAMARRSELEGRLLAILDPTMNRGAVRRARVLLSTLAVIAFAVPLAAFRPGARIVSQPTVVTAGPGTHVAVSSRPDTQLLAAPRVMPPSPSTDTRPRLWADDRTLATLSRRINALSSPSMQQIIAPLGRALPSDTEPPRLVDLPMLIEVTKAAKRMTSDHEKGELLALIAARYQRSDALRDAYLDAVFTMTGDYDKSRALLALLERDSLPLGAVPAVLRATTQMTSDVSRGAVLKRIPLTAFADTAVQRAYTGAITAMTSDVERGGAIASLTKQRPLSPAVQMSLLRAMATMSSNVEKANALLLFLARQGIADDSIRRAFLTTASTLTSDSDYRRVMTAVMR